MDDENLPLPTLEEVLICDLTTTAEEVFHHNMFGREGTIMTIIDSVHHAYNALFAHCSYDIG